MKLLLKKIAGITISASFLLLGSSALAQKKLVPVEHFISENMFSNPRLSPDGQHIAIKVKIMRNGRLTPMLHIYSLPSLQLISTMALPKFEIPLSVYWISNTRLVVTKGLEVGLREAPQATGEVIAVDLDGKKFEYLYGYDNFKSSNKGTRYLDDRGYGTLEGINENKNGNIYLGVHLWQGKSSSLYEIDTFKSTRKLITDIAKPNLSFYLTANGVPRFATGYDDENQQIVFRKDSAGQAWQAMSKEWIGSSFRPLEFTDNGEGLYFMQSEDGEPAALFKENLVTGKRTKLAHDANTDLSVQWTEYPYQPFAVVNQQGIPQFTYLDTNSSNAQLHKALAAQFPGAIVNFINFTDDGNKLLFGVASDRDPGSFYLFDRKTGTADLLFSVMPEIDPSEMAERRPVQVPTRDGQGIEAYLTMPKTDGIAAKAAPLIVFPHGGPHGVRDSWYFDSDAQFLASRGYAVLQVNYRGSSGRGENFRALGYREWGGKIQDDIIDSVNHLIKLGQVDSRRICSFGASFGAYSALMLAIREPNLFRCAIGYAGVYDLTYIFDEARAKNLKSTTNYFAKVLSQDPAVLRKNSPALNADKLKAPVWIIHGGKDEVTPPEHAYRMRKALIDAGNEPEWTFEPDEGHGFYDVERRKDLYLRLEQFLGKHLQMK
ncbi:alpha/beta hydrolase family protein [Undibacterium fentianense]|uniref:S9 family peptidase n=1 Tax=Undibacterium fentianense TaxID=2828728 RepID=A0A941DZC8_9BURK|nr:S9 family peptidase [Undibacterium fentianense]MBR7798441.1 S9 family peptidase [Undibacterium fentianense]